MQKKRRELVTWLRTVPTSVGCGYRIPAMNMKYLAWAGAAAVAALLAGCSKDDEIVDVSDQNQRAYIASRFSPNSEINYKGTLDASNLYIADKKLELGADVTANNGYLDQNFDIFLRTTYKAETPVSGTLAVAADAFSYDGGPLGHSAYNINVLALQAGGATYADGGTWSGSGTGLFLKLYTDVKYETIPAGTYTSGTGDFNYYTGGRSYIVDAESGTHYNINNGDVEITESGVSAKLITADNNAWSFTYSGTISETSHAYPYDSLTYDFTNDSFGSGTVAIDHNGTLFYGGYNNGWRFRLMEKEASSHYVQIVVWTEETDKLADTYPLNNGFCAKGTINIMGYGTTSLYYGGSNVYFNGGTEFKTPGFNREGNTVTVGFQGTFNANGSESVSEIGESRTVPITYNLDVTGFAFTVNSEAGA